MKPSSRWGVIVAFAAVLVVVASIPTFADTYQTADFSGAMFSAPNVKVPFLGNGFAGGGPVSGSFVFDNQLIPASGTGYQNVFFSTFPDSGIIPAATAFTLNLGTTPLTFTLADAANGSGAIQYNNGHFNGFFFQADFTFIDGNRYEFTSQGGQWNIQQLVDGFPTFNNLVTGYLNIGDGNLTNLQPYAPAVPIPSTMLLLGSGLAALAGLRRKFNL